MLGGEDVDPAGFGEREIEAGRRSRVDDAVDTPREIGVEAAGEPKVILSQVASHQADSLNHRLRGFQPKQFSKQPGPAECLAGVVH